MQPNAVIKEDGSPVQVVEQVSDPPSSHWRIICTPVITEDGSPVQVVEQVSDPPSSHWRIICTPVIMEDGSPVQVVEQVRNMISDSRANFSIIEPWFS